MVAIYFYPYQEINVPLFYISQMLSSIGMARAAVIGVVAGLGAQSKIVALAPAFIIMFDTEMDPDPRKEWIPPCPITDKITFVAVKLANLPQSRRKIRCGALPTTRSEWVGAELALRHKHRPIG
ncbi:hypothetical protein PMI07_006433 [Rhizobium sp. CF080]|uniref:hypothetical protein n=1 Tax=Rhizobium sp. (strain CF080) TaxID=1144310 RepID=UPI00027188E5|nr:hypothetical protein [Rhizobium sp. CF080]EUB98119.1 hypothetical protein PMI07_006433 [Rhizobium sp. CF080]